MFFKRLTPIVLLMVAFDSTWLAHLSRGPFWDKTALKERNSCRTNGWTNILYLNNYINKEDMVSINYLQQVRFHPFINFLLVTMSLGPHCAPVFSLLPHQFHTFHEVQNSF